MSRSLRLEFPGAFYQVMARGNRRDAIFHDDDDRRFFLATLSEACANLVAGMSWLQNTATCCHNVRQMAWNRLLFLKLALHA
jgi:hypothetical protein